MDVPSTDRLRVCFVDAAEGADRGRRLAATADDIAVSTVPDAETALEHVSEENPDCLVTTHEPAGVDGLALVARVADVRPALPTLVFAEPAEGLTDRALSAGATDVVPAVGPDRMARLAHRIRDGVDRVRREQTHETVQARFEALTQNTSFAVVTIDENSVIRYASDAVEDLFGYAPEAVVGESLTTVMPERFHDPHHAAVTDYLRTGERNLDWSWIELPGLTADGEEIPLGVTFGERVADDRRLFTAVIRDITDRKEREERLEHLASALENAMDGMAVLDADGRYRFVNDAHARMYGFDDPEEMVGERWQDRYEPDERARFESEVIPRLRERGRWRGEAVGRRTDGSTFPQEVSLTELDDGDVICVVRDITDRVERRQQLRAEQEFTESVLNALHDVFYVLDDDGTFRRWNDRLSEVTGYSDAELDGMPALELVPEEDHQLISGAISSVFTEGRAETVRSALVTKEGERIPYEFNGTRITDADGDVIGLAGTGRDITGKQLREQRLSVLSRVLRHNVRNRMTVVQANLDHLAGAVDDQALLDRVDSAQTAASELVRVSDRARRAESVLRDERTVDRQVDLAEVARAAVEEVDPGTATVRTDIPDSALAIAVPSVDMAVTELVENAIEHGADPAGESATVYLTVTDGDERVTVTVADDGPGIPEHERDVLTAGQETQLQHGIGIGLWLVNWIVTIAGGEIAFNPEREGSEVTLTFPSA